MLGYLEINNETGSKNYDTTTFNNLADLNEIFLYPPTKKNKNYFKNMHDIKIDLSKYMLVDHFENNIIIIH